MLQHSSEQRHMMGRRMNGRSPRRSIHDDPEFGSRSHLSPAMVDRHLYSQRGRNNNNRSPSPTRRSNRSSRSHHLTSRRNEEGPRTPRRDKKENRNISASPRKRRSPRVKEPETRHTSASPRQRRTSRRHESSRGEFSSPASRRSSSESLSAKSPQAEPAGTYFAGEIGGQTDDLSERSASVERHLLNPERLNQDDLDSFSDEEAPPVGVVVRKRHLFDSHPTEDVSVITEVTREPPARSLARPDHSPELRRKQALPLPRFPVHTVYSDESSNKSSRSIVKKPREADPSSSGSIHDNHYQSLEPSTTEEFSIADEQAWSGSRQMGPDTSTNGGSRQSTPQQTSDPPTYDTSGEGEQSSDDDGKNHAWKKRDAPPISCGSDVLGNGLSHLFSPSVSSLGVPRSAGSSEPALFVPTTHSTDSEESTGCCKSSDSPFVPDVFSVARSLSTEEHSMLNRDPSIDGIGIKYSEDSRSITCPRDPSIDEESENESAPGRSLTDDTKILHDHPPGRGPADDTKILHDHIPKKDVPSPNKVPGVESQGRLQPMENMGALAFSLSESSLEVPPGQHKKEEKSSLSPNPINTGTVGRKDTVNLSAQNDRKNKVSSFSGGKPPPVAAAPTPKLPPIAPVPKRSHDTKEKDLPKDPGRSKDFSFLKGGDGGGTRDKLTGILETSDLGKTLLPSKPKQPPIGSPNGEARENKSQSDHSISAGKKQDFLLPDNSLIEETPLLRNGLPATSSSTMADMAGIKGLFCCGTYGNEAKDHSSLDHQSQYPTMPHHNAALVHVMETIQEVDTAQSSRDDKSISDRDSPVLHLLSETETESFDDSSRKQQSPGNKTSHEPFPLIFAEDEASAEWKRGLEVETKPLNEGESVGYASLSVRTAPFMPEDYVCGGGSVKSAGSIYGFPISPPPKSKPTSIAVIVKTPNSPLQSPTSFIPGSPKLATKSFQIAMSGQSPQAEKTLGTFPNFPVKDNASKRNPNDGGLQQKSCQPFAAGSVRTLEQNTKDTTSNRGAQFTQDYCQESTAEDHPGTSRAVMKTGSNTATPSQTPAVQEQAEAILSTGFSCLLEDDDFRESDDDSFAKGGSTVGATTVFFDAEETFFDAEEYLDVESTFIKHGPLPPPPPEVNTSSLAPAADKNQRPAGRFGIPQSPASCGAEMEMFKALLSVESLQTCGAPQTRNGQGSGDDDLTFELPSNFSLASRSSGRRSGASPNAHGRSNFPSVSPRPHLHQDCRKSMISGGNESGWDSKLSSPTTQQKPAASSPVVGSRVNLIPTKSFRAGNKQANVHVCAIILQRHVRGMLVYKVFRQTINCVITLQTEARRRFAVRRLLRMKVARKIYLYAATIQSWARRWLTMRRFAWLRLWTRAAVVIQSQYRAYSAVMMLETARRSVVLLQALYRGRIVFKKFQILRISAVAIQKNYRRMSAFETFEKTKVSAICIQKIFRQWVCVSQYRTATIAAVLIQSRYRQHIAERTLQLSRKCAIGTQSAWRRCRARKNYKILRERAIVVQKFVRLWIASQSYRENKRAALLCQTARRRAVARRWYSRVLYGVKVCQGLVRTKIAVRKVHTLKKAIVTIQGYERRRQAQKTLRGAKIAWQIETAFSYSSNPATMPINLTNRAIVGTPMVALMDDQSEESTFAKTREGTEMELRAHTMEYEKILPSGCPPMVVLVAGQPGEPAAVNSDEYGSPTTQQGAKYLISKLLPKGCTPMNTFAQGSGSDSFEESFYPQSDISGVTTHDDFSAKDFTHYTKSYYAFSGGPSSPRKKTSIPEAIKKSCVNVLKCVNRNDARDSGEDTSPIGDARPRKNTQRTPIEPKSPSRGLGGLKIVFADTVEYEEDGRALLHGSAEDILSDLAIIAGTSRTPKNSDNKNHDQVDDETRQSGEEGTLEDTTARDADTLDSRRDVDTLDSSYFDEPIRRNATLASTRTTRSDPITEFLESALDFVCLTPSGLGHFWGNNPPSSPLQKSTRHDLSPTRAAPHESTHAPFFHRDNTPRSSNKHSRSSNQETTPRVSNLPSSRASRGDRNGALHQIPPRQPRLHPIHTQIPQKPPRFKEGKKSSNVYHRTPVTDEEDSDLLGNDRLFLLLANMLVEHFQARLIPGKLAMLLRPEDKSQVEVLLPGAKKEHFIKAVRQRLTSLPLEATDPLHIAIRRCQELGLHHEGIDNPIFAAANITSKTIEIGLENNMNSFENENAGLEKERQRLSAEIKEATALMNGCRNPETIQFWRNHVADLKRRLGQTGGKLMPRELTSEGIIQSDPNLAPEYAPPNLAPEYAPPSLHHHSGKETYLIENDLVDVISPADLPGGYHFEAEIEGQRFLATVPPGGVRQGETFACVMRELNSVAIDIPVGYWKDGMGHACRYGCFHASVCNSICCPLIALAQIGHRIHLDFLGRAQHPDSEQPFYSNRTMMCIVIMFWLLVNGGIFAGYYYKLYLGLELSLADYSALALINLAMVGFTIFVTQSTRYSLREKFMIREEQCYDLEDVVCSAFCLPCVICQMQRHTANYDNHQSVCCSKTGLTEGVGVHQENNQPSKSSFIV